MSKLRNRFAYATTAGRYAKAEQERMEKAGQEQLEKTSCKIAMSALLRQAPVERARCAAALIFSLLDTLPAELKVAGESSWRELQGLEEKLTTLQEKADA